MSLPKELSQCEVLSSLVRKALPLPTTRWLMRQTKLVCAKDEAVCRLLSAIGSTCSLSSSYLVVPT